MSPPDDRAFIRPVAQFADLVFSRCSDTYGPSKTPLLADAVDPANGEPLTWEGSILSNLACQQNFPARSRRSGHTHRRQRLR